jgi:hypothetical protein
LKSKPRVKLCLWAQHTTVRPSLRYFKFLVDRLLQLVFFPEPIQVKRPPSDYTLGNPVIIALLPGHLLPALD